MHVFAISCEDDCILVVMDFPYFLHFIASRIAETSRDAARDAATAKSAGTMWCLGMKGGFCLTLRCKAPPPNTTRPLRNIRPGIINHHHPLRRPDLGFVFFDDFLPIVP